MADGFHEVKLAYELLLAQGQPIKLQKQRKECRKILQALVKVCQDYRKELLAGMKDSTANNARTVKNKQKREGVVLEDTKQVATEVAEKVLEEPTEPKPESPKKSRKSRVKKN